LPRIHTRVCDVSKDAERRALYTWAKDNFPNLNILVNNAGVQKMVDLKKGATDIKKGENEIEINLVAPIYLSAYFIPFLVKQKEAAIINVSSGLGFVPIAAMPVYSATKAAIHSFCISLRYQLKDTSVKVFEIIPPMVNTELGKGSIQELPEEERGIPPFELAKEVLSLIQKDLYEIAIGESKGLVYGDRNTQEKIFQNMNQW
jgi:uncharacterized oxidoreductase